jgi:hypothetical protein
MDSADVPWYYHPFLVFFGALLPMAVIGWHATTVANFVGERRAQRLLRPRPKATYWLMALGCALVGGGAALLGWAAGANPAGEDWIATGLVWATVISASATLMMAGRALTVGTARRPAGLARRRNAPSANPSVAPATPAIPSNGNGLTAVAILPDLSGQKHQDQVSAEDLTGNRRSNPQRYLFPGKTKLIPEQGEAPYEQDDAHTTHRPRSERTLRCWRREPPRLAG